MPYQWAFDHKPFLTYFLYGLLANIKIPLDIFAIFALFWLMSTVFVIYFFVIEKKVSIIEVFCSIFACVVITRLFSGNTELIYNLFAIISIVMLLNFKDRRVSYMFSSLMAFLAVSV